MNNLLHIQEIELYMLGVGGYYIIKAKLGKIDTKYITEY
jgi:hypothetical protein